MVPDRLIGEVARMFALLGDPTRLRLVRALHERGELGVGELAEETGVTLANASQHLARLADAGLVGRRREGKSVLYRIDDPRLEQLCGTVCASVEERARALAGG